MLVTRSHKLGKSESPNDVEKGFKKQLFKINFHNIYRQHQFAFLLEEQFSIL